MIKYVIVFFKLPHSYTKAIIRTSSLELMSSSLIDRVLAS